MIQITLKSYNYETLYQYVKNLKKKSYFCDSKTLSLPKKTKKLTLLKSPHVYKKFKVYYKQTIYSTILRKNSKNIVNVLPLLKNTPNNILIKVVYL
jgi:ribosomal protein S10